MEFLKVVFVIIGTLVGAGFASGKEIFSFFFVYGRFGFFGLIISCFIIGYVVWRIFIICENCNICSYKELCEIIGGERFNKNNYINNYLNNVVSIFLLTTFFIMVSGFSSFLFQEFGIDRILGSFFIEFVCFFVFLKDTSGLVKVSNFLIPILIIFILFIAFVKGNGFCNVCDYMFGKSENIDVLGVLFKSYDSGIKFFGNVLSWFDIFGEKRVLSVKIYAGLKALVNSVLYASYNCIILVPIIIPIKNVLKKNGTEKNSIFLLISILSFILLVLLSLAIFSLFLIDNQECYKQEMPVISIASQFREIL